MGNSRHKLGKKLQKVKQKKVAGTPGKQNH